MNQSTNEHINMYHGRTAPIRPENRTGRRILAGLTAVTLMGAGTAHVAAQGCVAVRGADVCQLRTLDTLGLDGTNSQGGDWLAEVSSRYLHSTRHFVGDQEQYQRQAAGNQVINHQYFVDLDAQYQINPRWSVGLLLPFSFSSRSQFSTALKSRFETHADGIGDMRFNGYVWLLDPVKNPKGNIQLGLGLKVPTGDDGVTDTFVTSTGAAVVHPVDQSIQPGDGGWGFSVELNAYREIFDRTYVYVQGSYLFNPEDTNDVLTWRDNSSTTPGKVTVGPGSASYYEHFMSISDQYFARSGFTYVLKPSWGLSASLGARVEGVPVRDLIGSSNGFRRPGYAISIEPGIQLMKGPVSLNLSVPWAVYRNRLQSLADKQASAVSGTYINGDAAFADFVLTGSLAVRF